MAFATVDDLAARWRKLDGEESERACVLLEDAAAMLGSLVHVDERDERQASLLAIVSCSMVARAMSAAESSAYGMDSMSYTMGPFGQTAHFSNPTGDMYVSAGERRMLGIDGSYIRAVRPRIGGAR